MSLKDKVDWIEVKKSIPLYHQKDIDLAVEELKRRITLKTESKSAKNYTGFALRKVSRKEVIRDIDEVFGK